MQGMREGGREVSFADPYKPGFSEEDARTVKCYRGKGCSVCNNSGYKGRIALMR